jgi:type IV secretion system protein VirB7
MSLRLTLVLASLLGGCAAAPDAPLPVCDGRDRRPANPYGSILIASPPVPADAERSAEASTPTGGCA